MFIPACCVLILGILACGIVIKWPETPKHRKPSVHYENYIIDEDGTIVYHKSIDLKV